MSSINMDSMRTWAKRLGPGIITAALVFGPGSLTVTSKLGAIYQFDLLWVILISVILMMIYTSMGARIGMATEQSLLQSFKQKWGRWASLCAGIGIFLVTVSFQAGNTIAAGIAFAETFHTNTALWIILIVTLSILLLFYKSFYNVLEKVMISMIGIMLLSFLITLCISRPNLIQVLRGLIPSVPDGSSLLVIALVASSFSVVGAFYQSYLVQEKGWDKGEIKDVIKESQTGIFVLGVISATILITGGAVLFPEGISVSSASDMGLALRPAYGNWAAVLFMIGLFGAAFSSLIGNATIGGTLLSDSFSMGRDLSSNSVRFFISIIMITGAVIAILFGRLPLELIIFAQGITIFIAPFIGIGMFILANDEKIMGSLSNNKMQNIIGSIGIIVLIILAFKNFSNIFL